MTHRPLPAIGADLQAALEAERSASERADALVLEARAAGASWSQLAEITGLTAAAVRWRAQRSGEVRPEWLIERQRRAAAGEPAPPREPRDPRELTIAETARKLGVARPTVYQWIERGRLPGAGRTSDGRPFVRAEEDGTVQVLGG